MELLTSLLIHLIWAGVVVLALNIGRRFLLRDDALALRVETLELASKRIEQLASFTANNVETLRKEVRAPMTRKVNF